MHKKLLVVWMGFMMVALLAFAFPGGHVAASNSSPVHLTFDKSGGGGGVWNGTVGGDIEGNLTTTLTDLRVSGKIWHVVFTWEIDDTELSNGDQSFVATLRGVLNTQTGGVVMNGTVTEGYLLGAQVHEAGQLVGPATLQFQGTIRLMPATGG